MATIELLLGVAVAWVGYRLYKKQPILPKAQYGLEA